MKRIDLIKMIEAVGCVLVRHGGKHDWYRDPATGISQAVPRHREIKENLARRIIRMLSEQGGRGTEAGDTLQPPQNEGETSAN